MDKYIEQTILSVINQKGPFEIEFIIIDGNSKDDSVKIIKKYDKILKKDKRISFIWKSEKDEGLSDALNKGLKLATGDIIAWINSDDTYEKGAFARMQKEFKKHKHIGFMYGKCPVVNENNKEIRKGIKCIRTIIGRKYSYKKLLAINFIPAPATFWRKSIYDEFGGFDKNNHICMDYDYWCKIGSKHQGKFVNKNISRFRWYTTSKSGSGFKKQFEEDYDVAVHYANGKYKISIFIHKITEKLIIGIYNIMKISGK